MPRRTVPFVSGEYYHLYNRAVRRQMLFHNRGEYSLFLKKWREHVAPEQIAVIAYCLMPNHYHLLVRAGDDELSRHMQRFGVAFVRAWNLLREQTGVAFEGTFHAVHVDREEYLLHLSRYIHRNPAAAKLVLLPEDWEFSSYLEYLSLRDGSLPMPDVILREFGGSARYRRFVESASNSGAINHLKIDEDN